MMLRIDIHRWFAMAAILNPKWPPKYKNPPIWPKFGFQVDYDVVIFIVGFSSNSEHFKFFTFFVAMAAILKFLSLKIMCTHVRQNFWKVSSNSKHHSKPTMNITTS
jgi:hypothetical protein